MLPLLLCALISVAPGEDLNVLDTGSGPAVLLVPGLSGCAYSYRHVTPVLNEAGLRTIVVDPLAVGDSSRPADADYTLTAQSLRLAAVLDSLAVGDAVIVAQGMAATMAYRMTLARPDLVSGIVSLEGGPAESALTPSVERGLSLAKLITGMGGKRLIRDRYGDGLRRASGDPGWADRATVRRYFNGHLRDLDATLDAMRTMARQTEPALLGPRLPEITVPVVLMVGEVEHEGSLDPEQLAALVDGLPDLAVVRVAGAGHFLMEEAPEAVATAVIDLSAAVASAAPSPR